MMKWYENLSRSSGVRDYEIGSDYIDVQFHGGMVYRYSYRSLEPEKVECMKDLAGAGRGLNTYINRYARKGYERRWEGECWGNL